MFNKKDKTERQRRVSNKSNNYRSFSYYDSYRDKQDINLPRGESKLKAEHSSAFSKILGLFSFFVITISLGYLLWIDANPKISILSDSEDATLLQSSNVYQDAVKSMLIKSIFNKTKLTINTDKLARELKNKYPEIAEVAINIPIAGHRLLFEIEPAKKAVILDTIKSGSFVIDDNGRAVVLTSDVADIKVLNIPKVIDETGLEIKVGQSVMKKEDVMFTLSLNRQIQSTNRQIRIIKMSKFNELHVYLADKNYYIKFNLNSDVALQIGAFLAVEGKLSQEGVTPSEYIDVRVGGKVFYK